METDEARDFFEELEESLDAAASLIASAEALLIGAGAGMGVDSGLPDFRGEEGLWRSRSPHSGLAYEEIADPRWLRDDPPLAWGFYGRRLRAYRAADPHAGYARLLAWCFGRESFVFTSNVDDHFRRAGFERDRLLECHGSLAFLQCADNCSIAIWAMGEQDVDVGADERALEPLPSCPRCGGLARPNVLMFDDGEWNWERTRQQELRYHAWLAKTDGSRRVAIELGAGTAIPSVREACEAFGGRLIRINPGEPEAPPGAIVIRLGALKALEQIAIRFR